MSEPTSLFQRLPPSSSLLILKSSSVQSISPSNPPPHPLFLQPSVSPLCCWCIIMSEDEGMVCLCAPEGLPTHCLRERDTQRRQRREYNPALSFSSALFSPTSSVVRGLCGTALFLSLTHQQKRTKTHVRNKDQRGRTGCNSMFSFLFPLPHMARLDGPIAHTHATGSPPSDSIAKKMWCLTSVECSVINLG